MLVKCRKCGSPLEKDANFCIVCGENNAPTAPPTEAVQVPEQQVNLIQPQQLVQQAQPVIAQTETVETPEVVPTEQLTQPPVVQQTPNTEQEIIVPIDAEKDTVVTDLESENTSSLQEMPVIENQSNEVDVNKLKINLHENNPTIQRQIKKRRKSKDAKIIYTIAAIGGSIFIIIILGFVFAFYTSYKEGLENQKNKNATLKVGTKEYGYVQIPKTWTRFTNNSGRTLQYTDGAGWIITLYALPSQQMNAQTWTANIAEQMNSIGAIDVNVEQAKVDKYQGFKIFGFYNSASTYLSAWVMDGDDGYTHYIAIEGPNKFDENYEIVNTFTIEEQ